MNTTTLKTYSITCTCGDKMHVEAKSRDAAVRRFKDSMDELGVANHVAEKHPGEDAPSVEEMHEIIEATLVED